MSNRFDLEQDIMKCWNVIDDIALIERAISDGEYSNEKISEMLRSVQTMYELRFNELFKLFENMVKDKQII